MLLKDAYVLVDAAPVYKKSYVDLNQLRQCLGMFHAGILDEIDLERLWMRCDQLVPGNPLAGMLDSDTLRKCLFALPEQYRTAIALYYEPTDLELQQTLIHWYVHMGNPGQSFTEYQQEIYCDALVMLAEVVYRVL